ncbi:hypothetical protein BGX26_013015 [Mortierella sp. AD094]|nr:hypothetical protein BGX26_013015 [Mortierella sp. AD094]
MVLEKQATVAWFTPSRIATATIGIITTALTPEFSSQSSLLDLSQGCGQAADPVETKPVTHRTTILAPNSSDIVLNSSDIVLNSDKHADPLTVYGPAFEKVRLKPSRRRRIPRSKGATRNAIATSSSRSTRDKHHRQQGPIYPNDSILAPSYRSGESPTRDWITRNGRDSSCSSDEEGGPLFENLGEAKLAPLGWQDMYFSEMPLELLDNIFQQFMYVSHESLSRLAEERTQARNKASKRPSCQAEPIQKRRQLPLYLSKAGWGYGDFLDAEITRERLHMHYPHQYHPCLHLSSQSTGAHGHDFISHAHHHRQQALRQRQLMSNAPHCESLSRLLASRHNHCRNFDQEHDYDAEEEDDVDSESGVEVGQSKIRAARINLISDLTLDHLGRLTDSDSWETDPSENGDGEDYDSASSGSHEMRFGYQDDPLTDSANTYSDEDDYDDEYDGGGHSGTERANSTGQSRQDMGISATAALRRGARVDNIIHPSRPHGHLGDLLQCSCHSAEPVVSVFPRHGINRVDNELDEDKMLYQLHRDQYFHPTTHTSLRSDLYNCSLVNRQWRIAALQLLWQSVVLDSESCRVEPSDACYCCKTFEESKIARTRIEAMLDSYLGVYDLDLSKCVQTLELDLRVVAMAPATDIHAIKRILKRLSPFTHLRLVWTDRESSECQANGFEAVMGSMHSQIRHIYFSPGFIISKSWVREMEKMVKLETVTLESMGSLDVIEFDWTKIKCLRMNAVIPRNIFGMPTIPVSAMATIPNITGDFHDSALIVATASIQAILASTTTTVTGYGSAATNVVVTTTPMIHSHSNIVATHESGWGAISTADNTLGLGARVPGWWQWTGLRKIEIRIRNTVLPREWLQEFVATITQNSVMLEQQQKKIQASLPRHRTDSATASFGPPLEILDIDCAISHPHKDIFTQLIHAWGSRFEEFHVHQSAELTDEFFWLCLQKMARVKKLSLRESRGITGEGVAYCSDGTMKANHYTLASTPDAPNLGADATYNIPSDMLSLSNHTTSTTTSKAAKTPIIWRREFSELNLDQSRIRREFLETLKQHCPGVRYRVREIRRQTISQAQPIIDIKK